MELSQIVEEVKSCVSNCSDDSSLKTDPSMKDSKDKISDEDDDFSYR